MIRKTNQLQVDDLFNTANVSPVEIGDGLTTALGKLQGQINGMIIPFSIKTTNYTMTSDDGIILLNADGLTVTLPEGATCNNGQRFIVQLGDFASGTIEAYIGDTINWGITAYSLQGSGWNLEVYWCVDTWCIL